MPKVLDPTILNEIFRVSSKESVDMARRLAQEEGLLCGISSGAAVVASIRSVSCWHQHNPIVKTFYLFSCKMLPLFM